MRRRGCLSALLGALLLPVCVGAAEGVEGLPKADPCLDRPFTLSGERVYLGELLDRIGSQTGVSMAVDDSREAVSGIPLTVHLEARPTREVLDGLQALLSHRFLTWIWEAGPNGAYVLRPSQAPSAAAAQARSAAETRFHADLRELHALARGEAAAREARAKERESLFPGHAVDAGRVALLRTLRSEDVDRLVAGDEVLLPARGLSPEGRQALRLGITNPLPPGGVPADGLLQIRWQDAPPGPRKFRTGWRGLGPILYLRTGDMAANFLGGTFWDMEWLPAVAPGWRGEDDPEVKAWMDRKAEGPPRGTPLSETGQTALTLAVARRRHLNLLANFSGGRGQEFAAFRLADTPAETVSSLIARLRLTSRRSGELHLFRALSGITYYDAGLPTWAEIQALRRVAERNEGYPDLPTLLKLCELNDAQLAARSPELGERNLGPLGEHGVWRALLTFVRLLPESARSRVLAGEPVTYRNAPPEAQKALDDTREVYFQKIVARLNEDGVPAQLRFAIEPGKVARQEKLGRLLVCEIRLPDGRLYRRADALQPYRAAGDQL